VCGDEELANRASVLISGRKEKTLPGQCSFHCTKPDSSAEKTAVHTLLHKDYDYEDRR
jgi:hypothetical protein